MNIKKTIALLFCTLAGCNSTQAVIPTPPKEITLEQALRSVGIGLNEMRDAQGTLASGLIPDTVEITFKVTSSAKDENKLAIDAGAPSSAGIETKISGGIGETKEAHRGNEVKITFVNVLTAGEKSFLHGRRPEEVKTILDYLSNKNINAFFFPVKK
ncbi:MAG: hypothetical protein NTZ11_06235 [Gammaproteobacteria bacterium]|nr:hypothetical protein [Gammaproteobacteria bacterium]